MKRISAEGFWADGCYSVYFAASSLKISSCPTNFMKILLDTNFLMLPPQFGIDIYKELSGHEIATLKNCMDELEKLSRANKKAALALQLAGNHDIEILKAEKGHADKAILEYAKAHKCAVGTNDAKLIKALRSYGIKIVRMRQKKYLITE